MFKTREEKWYTGNGERVFVCLCVCVCLARYRTSGGPHGVWQCKRRMSLTGIGQRGTSPCRRCLSTGSGKGVVASKSLRWERPNWPARSLESSSQEAWRRTSRSSGGYLRTCVHDERVERDVLLVAVGKVLPVLRRLSGFCCCQLVRVWWQATE